MLSGMRSVSQPGPQNNQDQGSVKSLPDVYDRLASQISSIEELNKRTRKSVA